MRIGPASDPRWNTLLLALGAMSLQQTFAALGRNFPYVIAPAILDDLRLDAAWVGVYVAIAAFGSLLFQLGCGSFIVRYGALRTSQAALAMVAIGLAAAAGGPLVLFALSALIGGGGAAVSTPASSHLLGRYSPPRYLPLIFSIKQTAVPAGLLLAGVLAPQLTEWLGWRGAVLATAAACLGFAVALQPMRREFDSDRVPSRSFRFSDFHRTLAAVTATRELRHLSFACAAFNGLQTVFIAYFVTYLTTLGYGLAAAGLLFSAATLIAVPGRILWGWLGSVRSTPRQLLGWLALGMAASSTLLGLSGGDWPIAITAIAAVGLSLTALSWHGVLLAEAARLAPEGMRGSATGGVLSFGQVGALALPLVYGAVLGLTGSYGMGFVLCGLPAVAVGVTLLRRGKPPAPSV
ncbi:MFS transporter [Falsiroseomonas sp.]|uniref:MFS transporter n=1 Tax=Falsiroseomonas sp. TaxID=2870721 RepID=UPI003562ADFE